MTDEKKTGETETVKKAMISQPMAGKTDVDTETPYPGTLSWAATRLLEAIGDAVETVAEMLFESVSRVFRDACRLMRKLAKALDPKWQRRRRRALARSRRNNLYLKSIGRCR